MTSTLFRNVSLVTRRTALVAVVAALLAPALPRAQAGAPAAPIVGPAHGAVVVVGGNLHDPNIYRRFIQLAGGPDKLILVIPTAGGAPSYDQTYAGLKPWRAAGATNVQVLHTYDRAVADSAAFVEPITRAGGVFFDGGRQWRLADVYLHTRTQQALNDLLDRGGVIGGSSAGATILGSFLVRGDTKGNEIMIGDHVEGLGFLKNVAIDQHVLVRNRQFDLIDVVASHPSLLGIGLDENTAIVVQGDQLEVIGQSYALIYDPERRTNSKQPFYFLSVGTRFDLAARRVIRAANAPATAAAAPSTSAEAMPVTRLHVAAISSCHFYAPNLYSHLGNLEDWS